MLGGASGFNELQRGLPGISRSVLTDRLRSLERAELDPDLVIVWMARHGLSPGSALASVSEQRRLRLSARR
jgi:hypothetical protein